MPKLLDGGPQTFNAESLCRYCGKVTRVTLVLTGGGKGDRVDQDFGHMLGVWSISCCKMHPTPRTLNKKCYRRYGGGVSRGTLVLTEAKMLLYPAASVVVLLDTQHNR